MDAAARLPAALKATSEVTLRAPAKQVAISNMPVAARKLLGDGRARIRFAPATPEPPRG
jgi:aminopeptidase N